MAHCRPFQSGETEEAEAFFDSQEELCSVSSPDPALPWSGGLYSVRERRELFVRNMGLECGPSCCVDSVDSGVDVDKHEEVVPEMEGLPMPTWSAEETTSSGDGSPGGNAASGSSKDGDQKVGKTLSSLSFIHRLMHRHGRPLGAPKKIERRRNGWLRRLGVGACIVDRRGDEASTSYSGYEQSGSRYERVKVRLYQKRSKELSAVYRGQVIKAHDGAILAMKFSPDGQLLASGGEDGVVRVWHVMQTEECDIPADDPSCVYLKVEGRCRLAPANVNNEKKCKINGMKKSSESACVVIPTMVFRISEQPLHELRGHSGDVLDLSWSSSKHLLSASTDKTVRLWEIGCANCITIFPHSNFVTCVQFNPANENRFISGSVDGKIRVWDIPTCLVVDWADVRNIVTAVCYRPDAKGAVVGTITGNCRFYDASDNLLRLDSQIALSGKKKSSPKRITSFQFCPSNPGKLMVTSADSKIRILNGVNMIQNYSGHRSGSCQLSATFTPDGKHIISASEDSNIFIWNNENQYESACKQVKPTWSSERFHSSNAAIAIPWNGAKPRSLVSVASQILPSQEDIFQHKSKSEKYDSSHYGEDSFGNAVSESTRGIFSLSQELFLESSCKSSATWPEEMLPNCSIGATLDESRYKFLRSCCQSASHSWCQVIVTAGWDGQIRSYQNYGLPVHQ